MPPILHKSETKPMFASRVAREHTRSWTGSVQPCAADDITKDEGSYGVCKLDAPRNIRSVLFFQISNAAVTGKYRSARCYRVN